MSFIGLIWTLILCLPQVLTSSSDATLHVTYSPDSILLSTSHAIKSSSIGDFFSLTLGYTIPKPLNWNGLTSINNILHLPRAIVCLEVDGQYELTNQDDNQHISFPIVDMNDLEQQFDILAQRTYKRFPDKDPFLVKIDLAQEDLNASPEGGNVKIFEYLPISAAERYSLSLQDPEIKKLVSEGIFDTDIKAIRLFISEVGTVKQLLNALRKSKETMSNELWSVNRGVFWVQIHGLKQIMESSEMSKTTKSSAQRMLQNVIEEVTSEFRFLYNNRVMTSYIDHAKPIPLVRHSRSLVEESEDAGNKTQFQLNLAYPYASDFHVAFSMLAFTTILIAITVFGLGVAMWNMDPGKDTIIFRMTSQRKKDQ